MYSQDNLAPDFQRGGGQNIDPIPISELILGVGGVIQKGSLQILNHQKLPSLQMMDRAIHMINLQCKGIGFPTLPDVPQIS